MYGTMSLFVRTFKILLKMLRDTGKKVPCWFVGVTSLEKFYAVLFSCDTWSAVDKEGPLSDPERETRQYFSQRHIVSK